MNYHYGDKLEKQIGDTLANDNIKFERKNQRLDFFLPKYDIYIEVKKYHSNRAIAQLATQDNVILIQGVKAVKLFCGILNNSIPTAERRQRKPAQ